MNFSGLGKEMFSRLEPEISGDDPVYDRLIEGLNSDKQIIYAKINHGFWERLVALQQAGFDLDERDPKKLKEMDDVLVLNRPAPFMFEGGFVEDLFSCLRSIPYNNKNYIFSASLLALPKRHEIAGSIQNIDLCKSLMKRIVPIKTIESDADGMELKRAMITGGYVRFADALRKRHCLLVGNPDIETYFEFMGISNGEFIEIHPTHAREKKDELFTEIELKLSHHKAIDTVLLQAGGALSTSLSYQLHKNWPHVSFIDIGRGALICNPEKMFKTPFGKIYRRQIMQMTDQIKPGWLKKNTSEILFFNLRTGRTLSRTVGLKSDQSEGKINYHDPKIEISNPISLNLKPPPDENRIKQIASSISNPAALAEDTVCSLLKLSGGHKILLCSTQDRALEMAQSILGRAGYQASRKLIEYPNSLEIEGGGVWSQCHDYPMWNNFRHILRRENSKKSLIINNQNGFLLRPGSPRPRNELEVLAFSDEKPWGVNQVSALILTEDLKAKIDPKELAAVRVSKEDACTIIETIERYEGWSFFYQKQMKRIFDYVSKHFEHLEYVPGQLRIMSPVGKLTYHTSRPINVGAQKRMPFEVNIHKIDGSSQSEFSKIDIPCHPYMRHISESEFVNSLAQLF